MRMSLCCPAMASTPADQPVEPQHRGWLAHGVALLRRRLAPRCVVCDLEDGDPLCTACEHDYFAPASRCAVCAVRLPPGLSDSCGRCLRDPPHFDATFALADYAPPVDRMIIALKFGARLALADAFGRLLAQSAMTTLRAADVICAVPLAFERQAERGFNQAHEIARRCAAACGCRLRPQLLLRTRHTAAQMELSLAERRHNVRGAFVARADLAGAQVVVIDDVMTTGATLDEVASALKRAGADRVTNLVVARTP